MPKAGKPAFYAVAKGRVPGIYTTWDECQQQVTGFTGNKHQKFSTLEHAKSYLSQHGIDTNNDTPKPPPSSSVSSSIPSTWKRGQHGAKPYTKPVASVSKPESKAGDSKPSRWATVTTERIQDESGWDVVYSDGACKGNGKPGSVAGIGVWWGRDDPRYASSDNSLVFVTSPDAETSLKDAPEDKPTIAPN
ncbi:Caulimovirus viroplasmin-domain-containing protein [Dichomitus squalens]|nr:Caulimovirus viroplasmin-domain-containing protein [Dichomitus squalens]